MNSATKIQHARHAERGNLTALGRLLEELSVPTTPVKIPSYAVADVPAAASYTGHIIYCTNGAAGSPILAFSNGTNWLRCDTAAAVAAA